MASIVVQCKQCGHENTVIGHTHLTVSRKWNNPRITILVNHELISLSQDIEDFKKAVATELREELKQAVKDGIGSVTFHIGTKWVGRNVDETIETSIEELIDKAVGRVIAGVKEESAKVI